MKSKRETIRVTILNEVFSYPKMPFGIYELIKTSSGELVPGRELARAASYREARELIRKMGWEY
jgi:hypothetical protein